VSRGISPYRQPYWSGCVCITGGANRRTGCSPLNSVTISRSVIILFGACAAKAGQRAGIKYLVHPHLFRHACATHLLDAGTDLRTIQVLLGHADIQTTARYLRVSLQRLQATRSPCDVLHLKPIEPAKNDGRRR
jgi:integrase